MPTQVSRPMLKCCAVHAHPMQASVCESVWMCVCMHASSMLAYAGLRICCAARHPLPKVVAACRAAAVHYRLFLDSFCCPDGGRPTDVGADDAGHYAAAAFSLSRMLQSTAAACRQRRCGLVMGGGRVGENANLHAASPRPAEQMPTQPPYHSHPLPLAGSRLRCWRRLWAGWIAQ